MSRIPFDAESIRALAAILVETGLTEIELAESDARLRVVRAPATMVAPVAAPAAFAPPSGPAPQPATAGMGAAVQAAPAQEEDLSKHPGAVLSPMVGIAYLSPDPASAPFVTPGQPVAAGQTVMLIEAMKTFNQIKAPKAGTVTRVLVASGAPVEYGEPLLLIE